MKSFLAALQFLTIFPIRIKKITLKQISRSVIYFPIAGLLLGMALWAANYLLTLARFDTLMSNIILVVMLIIATGGLHLDGLSDTSDALFSGRDKSKMLRIMRDPHVGAMGVLALGSALMLKTAFLSSVIIATKGQALMLMCVLSRYSMVMSLYCFPYAREEGKGKVFADGMNIKIFIASTVITLVIAFMISGLAGLAILAVTALFGWLANLSITKKIGGITGDTIGAVSELSEIATLFGVALLERIIV